MTRRRMPRVGNGRVAVVLAAVAGLLAMGATSAVALTGPGGAPGQSGMPGQWSMAGQNIDDTHSQADEHTISPATVGRLAPRWTLTAAGGISATPLVSAGCVTLHISAARVKFSVLATARKYRTWWSSIGCSPSCHY